MNRKIISFGKFETASILINALTIKILLGLPQLWCKRVGNAAWIVALGSGLLFLAFVFLILKLYERFEAKNILEIAEALAGSLGKWICGILLLLPILFKGGIALRLAANTINLITPYRIPSLLTAALIGLVMIVTAYRGIEGVARMHALLVPVILVALLVVIASSVSDFHFTNWFPFWGIGEKTVRSEVFSAFLVYTDVLYLFLLFPYVKSQEVFRRSCLWGCGIAMLAQFCIIASYTLTTPYPQSGELFMPIYQVSRIIHFAHNSQSIEAIFFPVWILSSLLYLSLSITFVSEILGQASGTAYEKLFIVPAASAMFLIGYLPKSAMSAMRLSSALSLPLAFLTMGLPFLVLLLGFLKKGRRRPHEG